MSPKLIFMTPSIPAEPSAAQESQQTSTSRVRAFRSRQTSLGAISSGIVLSAKSQVAIEVIKMVRGARFKVRIIERALVQEACHLCPDGTHTQQLMQAGILTKEVGVAWQGVMDSSGAAAKETAAPRAKPQKRPKTQANQSLSQDLK